MSMTRRTMLGRLGGALAGVLGVAKGVGAQTGAEAAESTLAVDCETHTFRPDEGESGWRCVKCGSTEPKWEAVWTQPPTLTDHTGPVFIPYFRIAG